VSAVFPKHPYLNACWTDGDIYPMESVNVGVAMAVANRLVVQVTREACRKHLTETGVELQRLVETLRQHKLSLADLIGGTFAISSLRPTAWTISPRSLTNPPVVAIPGARRIVAPSAPGMKAPGDS